MGIFDAHFGYFYCIINKRYRGWKRAACIVGGAALGAINPFKCFKAFKYAKRGYRAYKRYKGTRAAAKRGVRLLKKGSRFKKLKNAHRYRGKHYTPKRPNKKLKSSKTSKRKKTKSVSKPALPKPQKLSKAEQVRENYKNGMAFERQVLSEHGWSKNTKKYFGSIPDAVVDGRIKEIKNTKYVCKKKQFENYKKTGMPIDLYIKRGTRITKQIRKIIHESKGEIHWQ